MWEAEICCADGQGTYILYGAGSIAATNIRVATLTVGESRRAQASLVAPRPTGKTEVDFAKSRRRRRGGRGPVRSRCFREAARDRREELRRPRRARKSSDGPKERERDQTRTMNKWNSSRSWPPRRNDYLVAILKTQRKTRAPVARRTATARAAAERLAMLASLRESGMARDPENKLIDLWIARRGGRYGQRASGRVQQAMAEKANGSGST